MPRPPLALLLAALVAATPAGAEDEPPARGELVSLHFAWPAPARAKVTYRRTRLRTGRPTGTFTARYETLAQATDGGLSLSTRATTWRGDLPFPPALAKEAIRASECVVQRIRPEGEFAALDGVEALRPVLARVLEDARIPQEQAERALALALAATRADAEELWNLSAGFWTGAELKIGETYEMQSEAELPLLPGVRGGQVVEFGVRRRVPCAAAEREPRCVEAVLRSTPDREALERAAPALLARLLPSGEAPPEDATKELSAGSELLLVTDPATLLPRRIVWTKAVRLGGGDRGPPRAEQVDRSEWDYRWLAPEPAPKRRGAPVAARAPR
ncbi:MAG TPA: hypothetical protein VF912_11070 [Anaeromyxobacter sp.]